MGGANIFGVYALINTCLSLLCMVVCWWVLSGIRIEKIFRTQHTVRARALLIILSIVLGHLLASFFIDYLDWSRSIGRLFV
ncbi:DUF1146 family protein [Hazenella coriacea]|nr:DUF1146 family protein [Hazenella coriacea]